MGLYEVSSSEVAAGDLPTRMNEVGSLDGYIDTAFQVYVSAVSMIEMGYRWTFVSCIFKCVEHYFNFSTTMRDTPTPPVRFSSKVPTLKGCMKEAI